MIDVNLLPEEDVTLREQAKLRHQAIAGLVIFSLVAGAILIGVFGYEQILLAQKSQLEGRQQTDEAQMSTLGPLAANFVTLRKRLAGIEYLQNSQFQFTKVFNYVQAQYPAGVNVNEINVDSTGKVVFTGQSQSSGAVGAMVAKLSTDTTLNNIKLSGLRMTEDGGFTFSINAQYGSASASLTSY